MYGKKRRVNEIVGTVLAAAAAIASMAPHYVASESSESPCLPDAVLPKDRQNVEVGEIDIPLGIWLGDWASASLVANVYKILVTEVIGYNATWSGSATSSTAGLYAVAGCKEPLKYSSDPDCKSRDSLSHVVLEVWGVAKVATMKEKMKDVPEIIPENLGTLGYDGTDGLFVKGPEKDAAYNTEGLALDFYKAYNVSWTQSWTYFDRWTDFNPEDLLRCNETRATNSDEMAKYVRITGDEAGVDSSAGQMKGRCWSERWWLSPACRSTPTNCIPVITGGSGWGMFDFQQKGAKYNMPLAIAVASNKTNYASLARNYRVLLYTYSPDSTLIDFKPGAVLFPVYNRRLWDSGDRTTMSTNTLLSKWVWNQLLEVAPRAYGLAKQLSLGIDMVDKMILDEVTSGDSIPVVACKWLRENRDIWNPWIPGVADCMPGQGIADKRGGFLTTSTEKKNVAGCAWCLPGRYSFQNTSEENALYTCSACQVGRFSDTNGATECLPAPAGTYVAKEGRRKSYPCPIGTYMSLEGQSACKLCNEHPVPDASNGGKILPLTTALLGATDKSFCVCGPETYLHDASCVVCTELQWFKCQTTFGTDPPRINPGYMSLPEEPLIVYECTHRSSCQGIRDPFATPPDPMCSNNQTGLACNRCQAGFASRGEGCVSCQPQEGGSNIMDAVPAWFDLVYAFILLLVTCTWIFNMSMRKPTAERLIWGMIIGFMQTFSVIGNFSISFPLNLNNILQAIDFFNFKLEYVGVRSDCFWGTAFTMRLLVRMAWPLILQVGFGIVFVIWQCAHRICGDEFPQKLLEKSCIKRFVPKFVTNHILEVVTRFLPMLSQNMLNCMQRAHLGLFIAVLSISFSLFDCRKHPSGRYTVEAFLDVECDSEEWWEAFPLGLVGVLIYCVGFASWILYLIYLAPYRVGIDPYFAKANRFIWGKWHPGKWWFTLMELTLAISVNLVSILLQNAYVQIYITTMFLIVYMVVLNNMKPWKFIQNTTVDAVMKLALVLILLLATAFVNITKEEQDEARDQFKDLLMCIPFVPVLLAISFLIQVLWRKHYALHLSHIDRMLFAQRFRDVMTMACHMSNPEFNKLITIDLCDNDRLELVQAADVLVATVLKMQPGNSFWQRRIIPGKPYVVANNESIDEAIVERGIHDLPSVKERLLLHRVALGLSDSASERARPSGLKRGASGIGLQHQNTFKNLDVSGDGTVSREEFVRALHQKFEMAGTRIDAKDKLTDEEIGTVFDMMDIDGGGEITVDEFSAVIEVATHSSKDLQARTNHKSPFGKSSSKKAIMSEEQAASKIQVTFRKKLAKRDGQHSSANSHKSSSSPEDRNQTKSSGPPEDPNPTKSLGPPEDSNQVAAPRDSVPEERNRQNLDHLPPAPKLAVARDGTVLHLMEPPDVTSSPQFAVGALSDSSIVQLNGVTNPAEWPGTSKGDSPERREREIDPNSIQFVESNTVRAGCVDWANCCSRLSAGHVPEVRHTSLD